MIANTDVDADDLVALGNRRAQAVKDWLLKNGQIPGERVFILATRSATAEAKSDKEASPSRVDFSLK
jgi:outer membrane protein OmpA-like peptidoglycan-associated protein